MNNLAEEVCWAWLRLQTEVNNPKPNEQLIDSLIYLHNESFNEWMKDNNIPTNFNTRPSNKPLSFCDAARCYQVSIKKLNDEIDNKLIDVFNQKKNRK